MNLVIGTIVLLAFLLPSRSAADSISCDRGIVSSGDPAVDLILKCGQPEWKDTRTEEIHEGIGTESRRTTSVTVEDWTYNFGPYQFMRSSRSGMAWSPRAVPVSTAPRRTGGALENAQLYRTAQSRLR